MSLKQRRHMLKLAVRGFWGGWIYGPIRYRSWEFCGIWRDRAIDDLKRAIRGDDCSSTRIAPRKHENPGR